jgi:hypothetical protein
MKSGNFVKSLVNLSNTHSEWIHDHIPKILFLLPNIQLVFAVVCHKAYFFDSPNWAFAVSVEMNQLPFVHAPLSLTIFLKN